MCAALILASQPTKGQAPPGSAQDRARLLGQGALPTPTVAPTAETQGYAVASPNEEDIGEQQILKRMEEYRPFTISVYSPFFWTSNAALVSSGEEDDVLVAPGVTLLYQPRITKTFFAEVGVVQQFFLYDRFPELNFGSLDVIAGAVYYLPQFHNLSLRAVYDYNRLTDTDNFDELFVNNSIILNAELPFRIARAQQIFLGLNLNLSFYGNPESPRRNNYSLYANYDLALTRSFSLDAGFQFVVRDYYSSDRTDVNEILALSANYRVRDWLTLSALSSFSWNQSNQSVFDYSVANIGGGVALTLKF
jgi:Putative beta-barrel porin 2